MHDTHDSAVAVDQPFKRVCAPTETRHRMAPARIPENPISQMPEQDPRGTRPSARIHPALTPT